MLKESFPDEAELRVLKTACHTPQHRAWQKRVTSLVSHPVRPWDLLSSQSRPSRLSVLLPGALGRHRK